MGITRLQLKPFTVKLLGVCVTSHLSAQLSKASNVDFSASGTRATSSTAVSSHPSEDRLEIAQHVRAEFRVL